MTFLAEFSQTEPTRRVSEDTRCSHVSHSIYNLNTGICCLSTDYDCALKVMAASGKLAELVAKQQRGKVLTLCHLHLWFIVNTKSKVPSLH